MGCLSSSLPWLSKLRNQLLAALSVTLCHHSTTQMTITESMCLHHQENSRHKSLWLQHVLGQDVGSTPSRRQPVTSGLGVEEKGHKTTAGKMRVHSPVRPLSGSSPCKFCSVSSLTKEKFLVMPTSLEARFVNFSGHFPTHRTGPIRERTWPWSQMGPELKSKLCILGKPTADFFL